MRESLIIQEIIPKKKHNYFIVKFDNSNEILLHSDLIFKYKLSQKQKISLEQFEQILSEQQLMDAKKIAYDYVSYKPRTEYQVIKKLKDKNFKDDIISDVIKFLHNFNLVDDEKFAKIYSEEIVKRKKIGKSKLLIELRKKGIDDEITTKVADELFEKIDTQQLAESSANKKLKMISHKPKAKQKQLLIQHLQRQGFEWDLIKIILERFKNNFE